MVLEQYRADVVHRMEASVPHYHVEIILCLVLISLTGGLFTVMAYLTTYVTEYDLESYNAGYAQVTVGYAFSVLAVILGFLDQAYLVKTHDDILWRMYVCCCLGGLVMLLPLVFPSSLYICWIATTCYMFFNGPLYGYLYDWMNRLTYTTETGTALLTFGMNAGSAIVIVTVIGIWYNLGAGPVSLIYCGIVTMWIPLPLLWIAQYQSYRKDIQASWKAQQGKALDTRGAYEVIPDSEQPSSMDF